MNYPQNPNQQLSGLEVGLSTALREVAYEAGNQSAFPFPHAVNLDALFRPVVSSLPAMGEFSGNKEPSSAGSVFSFSSQILVYLVSSTYTLLNRGESHRTKLTTFKGNNLVAFSISRMY